MKKLEKSKGITLIALVVTIIILLILAGVSLSLIAGENGILGRATTAVDRTKKETAKEELELAISDVKMGWYEEGRPGSLKDYMINHLENYSTATGNVTCDKEGNVTYTGNGTAKGTIDENGDFKLTGTGNPEKPSVLEKLKVGSTVSYSPSGTYDWNAEYATSYDTTSTNYTNANQSLNSGAGGSFQVTSWKVLSIEGEQVKMVPSALNSGSVVLWGPQGYNNAVYLLNEACSRLYADESKGITARSINIEDIEGCMTEVGIAVRDAYTNTTDSTESVSYGGRHQIAYRGYRDSNGAYINSYNINYPVIYEEENGSIIDGGIEKTGELGLSEQTRLYERSEGDGAAEKKANRSIHPKQTRYIINSLSSNLKTECGSLFPDSNFWVASRCVRLYDTYCGYDVFAASSEGLGSFKLSDSNAYGVSPSLPLFPVVSLEAGLIGWDPSSDFSVK